MIKLWAYVVEWTDAADVVPEGLVVTTFGAINGAAVIKIADATEERAVFAMEFLCLHNVKNKAQPSTAALVND